MTKILITDSLFINQAEEKILSSKGYEFRRLDKPAASEGELVSAISDVDGYILGGTEQVTETVIKAAKKLRAIAFTGSGYTDFIPAHDFATQRGIAIANAPGGVSDAVAEFLLATLLMQRRALSEFGPDGKTSFKTTQGLVGSYVGIIGFGRVGQTLAKMLVPFNPKSIYYWNRSVASEAKSLGVDYVDLLELAKKCDVVVVCVASEAGRPLLDQDFIQAMPNASIIANISTNALIDLSALLTRVKSGEIGLITDHKLPEEWRGVPSSKCYVTNGSTAFNTESAIRRTSQMAVNSMINLLNSGKDQYLVNPEFMRYKLVG